MSVARRRARGFTLTEMLVVVVLMAVFASLSLLAVGNDQGADQLDKFARAIANQIQLARRRAVATQTTWYLDLRPNSAQICQQAPGAGVTTCPNGASYEFYPAFQADSDATVAFYATSTDAPTLNAAAPAKLSIGAGTTLVFNPNGSCDGNPATPQPDGFTVYLQSALYPDKKRAVAVYPLTARPRVTDTW